jgi:peroxiredoxin
LALVALSWASLAGCNTASEGATAETPASAQQAGADVAPEKATAPSEKPSGAAGAVVGQPAPAFALTDLDGKEHKLADYQGKVVVLEWFNPKCPFVRANHTEGSLKGMATKYRDKGVVWLAINSGAPGKQGAGREVNGEAKGEFGMEYPIALDESGEVGKAYGAETTPHMFVIDEKGTVVYAGGIDNEPDADPGDGVELENYVGAALDDVLAGKPVRKATAKPYGCSVKYSS